jgi:hypothetical protein
MAQTSKALRPQGGDQVPAQLQIRRRVIYMDEPQFHSPTKELAQHHDLAPPSKLSATKGWEVKSRVDSLHKGGRIDDAEKAACDRWLKDWEMGVAGVVQPGLSERVDNDNLRCAMDGRIDALSRLRRVRDEIGLLNESLIEMCVARDMSWVEIGRRIGTTNKPALERGVAAITKLSDAYSRIDSKKNA